MYHGKDYLEENDNMKIIIDKDKWAYTICLCIYNVTMALAGKITIVATNECGSDETVLFIDVEGLFT
jgi:hypothetical protein